MLTVMERACHAFPTNKDLQEYFRLGFNTARQDGGVGQSIKTLAHFPLFSPENRAYMQGWEQGIRSVDRRCGSRSA